MKRLARVLALSGVVAASVWASSAPAKGVVICDNLAGMGCIGNHTIQCEWSYGDPGFCQCVGGEWDCL